MAERVVGIGTQRYTKVVCVDEPGAGGACHRYQVIPTETPEGEDTPRFAVVGFQNGPIKEAGVNGCHNEDLIAIVMDRLRAFQSGDFACEENGKALVHLASAMDALRCRTDEREKRGVEGTSEK